MHDKIYIIIHCSASYFLELGVDVSLKWPPKVLLGVKISGNLAFLDYFSKAKMGEYDQSKLCFCHYFGTFIPW